MCKQYDYYLIGIVTLNPINVYKLLLDRNTWNHICVCIQTNDRQKYNFLKNAMEILFVCYDISTFVGYLMPNPLFI